MKKLCFVMLSLIFFWPPAFGDAGEQEICFLLFSPNSSNRFMDEEQEMIHLDKLAAYLLSRNLTPGQIHVHGYAAAAKNDIDPRDLSMERAFFVISELQRRGVPEYLFSHPEAHGEVDIWGSNIGEHDKSPNRRVRIMLGDYQVTTAAFIPVVATANAPSTGFPRKLILPLLAILAAIIIFAIKTRGRASYTALAAEEQLVNLEEEIRRRAYELYLARNGQGGDAEGDWYKAIPEIRSQYEANVYEVYTENGYWWAHR